MGNKQDKTKIPGFVDYLQLRKDKQEIIHARAHTHTSNDNCPEKNKGGEGNGEGSQGRLPKEVTFEPRAQEGIGSVGSSGESFPSKGKQQVQRP